MEEFWKADIFFLVTTITVIFAAIGGLVLAMYAFSVLKEIKLLVVRLRRETDQLAGDVQATRERIAAEGWLSIMMSQWSRYQRAQKKNKQ